MPRTRRALLSITVADLIAALQDEDPEALVVFSSDYGDITHTEQVHAIKGEVEEVTLEETAYSGSGWAVRHADDDDDEDADETVPVLVIK